MFRMRALQDGNGGALPAKPRIQNASKAKSGPADKLFDEPRRENPRVALNRNQE